MNVYYNPDKCGLVILGEACDEELSYEFDQFIVWVDAEGKYFWASDSGCSCPEPFGGLGVSDLETGTIAQARAALEEWARGSAGKEGSAAELGLKLASLI